MTELDYEAEQARQRVAKSDAQHRSEVTDRWNEDLPRPGLTPEQEDARRQKLDERLRSLWAEFPLDERPRLLQLMEACVEMRKLREGHGREKAIKDFKLQVSFFLSTVPGGIGLFKNLVKVIRR